MVSGTINNAYKFHKNLMGSGTTIKPAPIIPVSIRIPIARDIIIDVFKFIHQPILIVSSDLVAYFFQTVIDQPCFQKEQNDRQEI